ncbi:MAG: DUF2905 domain-containing protein [Mycobacterium sp.]|uniref:DUF2905 domain-containing protein n=1 Tax=Mycobacterium sp. TaxID=1785 RepID=UPI00262DC11B|nr:DUF2905 domain-containing protein [Mycobacterium sp.]MDI3315266.1 DUF2905 domain-containing protein [Mycobacterium sp.]
MVRNVGPFIVMAGIAVVVVGILVWTGGLSWFGRLPGDIRIVHGNLRVYIPIVSMLVISVAASVVLFFVQYLFRR